MSKIAQLTPKEVDRFHGMHREVQDATRGQIDFLRQRTKELASMGGHRDCFRVEEFAGGPMIDMHGVFAGMLQDTRDIEDKTQRAALVTQQATEMAELVSLVKRARNKDMDAIAELNGLWMEKIDLTLRADCNFLTFFRPVTVADGDTIRYEHTYRTEVSVKYVSQDGGPRVRRAVTSRKFTHLDFQELWTEEVEYALRDINQGSNIADMALKTIELAQGMESKLNNLAKTLYDTLLGTFTKTGAALNRTYVKTGDINEDNLPTTNSLTCTGNTATSKFRIEAITLVMDMCTKWANTWGRPIKPTGLIYIPSSSGADLATQFDPTGEHGTIVSERIVDSNYLRFSWFGVNWTLVPDATLAPGYAYFVLNEPVGDFFSKPSMDESFVETFPKKNLERRSAMKVIQFGSPEPKRIFACRVKYRN